jgi:hypothetical protein
MFPNVRLLVAAMIVSVVAVSCGFAVFAAFRVNHEPLAGLPSATAPLQLLASLSPSPPITVAAVEPFDRGLRANPPAASDLAASPSAPDLPTSPLPTNSVDATIPSQEAHAAVAERETNPSPAKELAGASEPSSTAGPDIATAVEGPADPAVEAEPAGSETGLVSRGLEHSEAKTAKTARKKSARKHLASRRHRAPNPGFGFAVPDTQESTSAVGGPFVRPAGW